MSIHRIFVSARSYQQNFHYRAPNGRFCRGHRSWLQLVVSQDSVLYQSRNKLMAFLWWTRIHRSLSVTESKKKNVIYVLFFRYKIVSSWNLFSFFVVVIAERRSYSKYGRIVHSTVLVSFKFINLTQLSSLFLHKLRHSHSIFMYELHWILNYNSHSKLLL